MPRTAADFPGFPADLATEFDATTARITAIQTQMDALRDELKPLQDAQRAALDLYAESTDDQAALLSLVDRSQIAFRKVEAHIRTLHPYMYSFSQYLFPAWDDNGKPKGKTVVLTGPHVSLMRHRDRPLTTSQAGPLADALIEFARIYVPDPIGLLPEWEMGDHTGMVQCDFVTEHGDSPAVWYTPDGTHAIYYPDTTNGHTGYSSRTGTLAAVLRVAIDDAARPIAEDDRDW